MPRRKQEDERLRAEDIERINNGTTFYEYLGVSSTARPEEITIAYRRIEQRLNPDNSPGTGAEHRAIVNAYKTLSDAKERRKYDNSLQPSQSIKEKLSEAFHSFCSAISSFVNKYRHREESKQEHQNPRNQ